MLQRTLGHVSKAEFIRIVTNNLLPNSPVTKQDIMAAEDIYRPELGSVNYMDPRISVAWCKRNEVPIEKIFSKTLRDKFNWAMAVPGEWEFNAKVSMGQK